MGTTSMYIYIIYGPQGPYMCRTQTSEFLWSWKTESVHRTRRLLEASEGMVPRNFLKMRITELITPGKFPGSYCCCH